MNKTTIKTIYNNKVLLLLVSVFINTMGLGIVQMYSLIYIYSETNSNFYAALQGAVIFGAGIISSYFYVLHKRICSFERYMLTSEFVCFLATLVIACAQTVILMYISLLIVYLAYGFFKPSYQAILYQAASSKWITKINSTYSIVSNLAFALSWLCAPLCFAKINYRGLFFFAAVAHLVSGCFILRVRTKMKQQNILPYAAFINVPLYQNYENCNLSARQSSKTGILLINILFLVVAITIVKAAIDALEMGVFRKVYHLSDLLIGVFFVFWIFGGVIAGIAYKIFFRRMFKNSWLMRMNVLIFILTAFIFAYSRNKSIGIGIYAICGFLYVFFDIFSNDYIYQKTVKEKHAYNFGLKNIVFNGSMLICLPVLGYVADMASILAAMIMAMVISFLFIVFEAIEGRWGKQLANCFF